MYICIYTLQEQVVSASLDAWRSFFSNQQRAPPVKLHTSFSEYFRVLDGKTVPLLCSTRLFSLISIQKEEVCWEDPSGSVSDVVAQEHDVVCNDGGGLASHLVLVYILSIVQFSLH